MRIYYEVPPLAAFPSVGLFPGTGKQDINEQIVAAIANETILDNPTKTGSKWFSFDLRTFRPRLLLSPNHKLSLVPATKINRTCVLSRPYNEPHVATVEKNSLAPRPGQNWQCHISSSPTAWCSKAHLDAPPLIKLFEGRFCRSDH